MERKRELDRIETALESACAGTGRAIVIEGGAGIGKTALVEAARVGARARGMGVLDARGSELEAEYPFSVVRQCLEPALRAADTRDREQLLAGAAALAAPVLLDAPSEGEVASFGVLHGLYWLLANLSERGPLLLAIDDAHWVDEPSLRFVAHLTRRVESLPAMLILATRPVDPSDREPGLLAELLADPDRELLTPAVLGEPAVAELLSESVAGPVDERFARACHHASGGNPFLLTELERTLRDEQIAFTDAGAQRVGEITPLQVARATRARLARLDPAAGALARAIVVLGDDAPLDLACELGGLERTVATRAADALISAGLLDPGWLLRFRHPLLRSAVAASLTPFEREGSHRSAAELLRDRGAPPERIAVHLLATTPSGQGADAQTLLAAATRAVERGAPGAAVPLFLRALDEPLDGGKRTSVLLGLGRAEFAAGHVAAAAEHLDQARRGAGDLISRARALVLLMDASTQSAANIQALVEVAPAIEEISEHDRELALRLQAWVMLIRHPATAISDARLEQLSALPGDTPGEAVVLAHLVFDEWRVRLPKRSPTSLSGRPARSTRSCRMAPPQPHSRRSCWACAGLTGSTRLSACSNGRSRSLAAAGQRSTLPMRWTYAQRCS